MVITVKPVKKFVTKCRDDIAPMQIVWEGDYEDNKDTLDNNKIHHNLMFTEEKEGGTFLTSVNLSDELERWKTMAYFKGWQGVWEPAKHTDNNAD
eukprot:12999118-Heterocapsa_arctica.AAC.1